MTHLRIEQNNGITEQVSPSVIEKLYEIVHSGNLDSSSNLMGSLNTTSTYLNYVDYLEELFTKNGVRLLIITANKLYISFADPTIASYWANSSYGDGVGITSSDANSVLSITNNAFKDNTNILTFDELSRYFPNCTTINLYAFSRTNNLRSIDLSNVTSIGKFAFLGCSLLTNVNLSNVTTIGGVAFLNCTSLTTIVGLSNVTSISDDTFSGCSALTTVDLSNITSIGNSAFRGCPLSNIDLSNVTTIGNETFRNCTALTSVGDLSNATSIGYNAFLGCSALTSVDLSNVTTIGNNAFKGCTSLTSVDLSSFSGTPFAAFLNCTGLQCVDLTGFTTFGDSMFAGCSSLIDLTTSNISNINTGVETCTFNWTIVSSGCFLDASFANKSFNLPEVTEIKQNGFLRTKLVSVNAPKIVTLGSWAFSGCTNLLSVTFGDYITSLGSLAFENCTALTTVTFGANSSFSLGSSFLGCSNLTTITNIANCNELGTGAFRNCTSLGVNETLELNLTNQTSNPENPFNGTKYKGLILHWPNAISSWRTNYPLWEGMDLEYLDISDTKWPNQANKVSWYGNSNIETCILSPDFNLVDYEFFDERRNFKYLILLNPNVVTLNYHEKIDRIFRYGYSSMLHIYVLDSLVSSYLSDANWSRTGDETQSFDLSTRILPLSLLPAGVWTTGLASLYLTPAQLATS